MEETWGAYTAVLPPPEVIFLMMMIKIDDIDNSNDDNGNINDDNDNTIIGQV